VTKLYTDDAELYDIAFDRNVSAEADWLVERPGSESRSVLEPGCGSGRILEALAERGLAQVGLVESNQDEPFAGTHWEASRGDIKLKLDWEDEKIDLERGISRQRSRIEVSRATEPAR
jgi:hypothetical protein